jgi:uncharacterized protein (TIRG00374 family)
VSDSSLSTATAVRASRRRRLILGLVAAALVAVAFVAIFPRLADYGNVWGDIRAIPVATLALLTLLAIAHQFVNPLMTMAVIPDLTFRHALVARLASTAAANTIPGGGAVGVGITYVMLGRWGHPGSQIGAAVALTGVWNNLVKLLLPALALVGAMLSGLAMPDLLDATLIGAVALLVVILVAVAVARSSLRHALLGPVERFVGWIRRLFGRAEMTGDRSPVTDFFTAVGAALGTRWRQMLLSTLAAHISLFLVLLACLRAAEVASGVVPWPEVLAAFAIIRLLSAIPITPGGLGVAELGLVGLIASGMAEPGVERVAAAVLLFRFFTYLLPTIVGGVVAIGWHRRTNRVTGAARWGLDDVPPEHLEEAVCFRCRIPGKLRWDLDPFALVDCPKCGQAFMSPRLNEAGRTALYGNAKYFDDGVYRNTGAEAMQRRWSAGRLDLIEHHLGRRPPPRIFEVGCAYGMFLEAARERGFDLGGLEYSAVAAETASGRLGVPIHVGEVMSLPPTEEWDAVAFWDVIEHVPDPGAFLAAAAGLTSPGGVIAFSCPNFDSLPARLLRRRWWTLKPHKHIWHFRKKDLRRVVADAGLETLQMIRSPLRQANWVRLDSLVVVARKP